MALVLALFAGTAFSPADVAAAGITIRTAPLAEIVERAQNPAATGWIGCGATCDVLVWNGFAPQEAAAVTRHEVCHGMDAIIDGKMDGSLAGWQPWAGTVPAWGEPTDDVERLGYWCGRQEVRG